MSDLITYTLFRILPTMLVLLVAIYLAYIRLNPARRASVLAKYKKGTPGYEMYEKTFSSQFLVVWSLIAVSSIFDLTFDLYRSAHFPSLLVLVLGAMLSLSISFVVLYMLFRLFKKK